MHLVSSLFAERCCVITVDSSVIQKHLINDQNETIPKHMISCKFSLPWEMWLTLTRILLNQLLASGLLAS